MHAESRSDETTGVDAFADRLSLLEDSGQVTGVARGLTEDLIGRIERGFDVRLDEANGAQLVTHVAMALSRVQRGDVETEVSAVVEDEIAACDRERAFIDEIVKDWTSRLGREIPQAEVLYVVIHLCALAQRDDS